MHNCTHRLEGDTANLSNHRGVKLTPSLAKIFSLFTKSA